MDNTLRLILREDVQKIFDHFAATVNKNIIFFSPDGEILRSGLNIKNSEFCRIIQNCIFDPGCCRAEDLSKMQESIKAKRLICYRCHAGIQEAVAPIFVENQLAGFAMIGQFRTAKSIKASVRKACTDRKLYAKLETAFRKLPYYPPQKLQDVLGMFSMLVDHIVAKELVSIHGDRVISRINSFIDANLHRNITLTETARHAGKSCSTVSHLFRKKLSMSFKQHLLNKKIEKAEEYFRVNPEMTIEEVAAKTGFDDQFYFSRLYKKYRKITPSEYRHSFRSK